jgi:hypothetical protein
MLAEIRVSCDLDKVLLSKITQQRLSCTFPYPSLACAVTVSVKGKVVPMLNSLSSTP